MRNSAAESSFVNGGGKLIIYTSELSSSWANAFANFIYPFTVDTPGQTGSSGGTLVNLADDTLSSSNSADAIYIILSQIVSQTDAVGDCNVMTSVDPNWYIDMTAINVHNVGGPAHTYAFYGAGLIIFNGLDIDYGGQSYPPSNANGRTGIGLIWYRELCGQTLGPGQSVSGLTLTPATAVNAPGTQHTVTALVKDTINNPMAGVTVNFLITSGPSAGLSGSDISDVNGEATFTWSSAVPGIDTVQASITKPTGQIVTTTATKTWQQSFVIPEYPLGTLVGLSICIAALAVYGTKRLSITR